MTIYFSKIKIISLVLLFILRSCQERKRNLKKEVKVGTKVGVLGSGNALRKEVKQGAEDKLAD